MIGKILNKRICEIENNLIKNFKRPFISKRIKIGPIHLYRKTGTMCSSFRHLFKDTSILNHPWEGVTFEEWENKIKRLCPIQFFIRHELIPTIKDWICIFYVDTLQIRPSIKSVIEGYKPKELSFMEYISNIHINPDSQPYKKYYSLKIFIKDLIYPHNVLKISGLKRSWVDTDYKMLYAMRQLLIDFVENENPTKPEDYEPDIHVDINGKEIDYSLTQIEDSKKVYELYYWFKDLPKKIEQSWELSHEESILFDKEIEEKLIELIKIRKNLWT